MSQQQEKNRQHQEQPRRYAILDCDGGSDDAWALLFLLHAEQQGILELLAVTTNGCGNTTRENAARNMRRILNECQRGNLPIYLGAAEALISGGGNSETADKKYFHGRDGFGDCLELDDVLVDVEAIVQRDQHAVCAIYELCKRRTKDVTIFAVGPLTNLALGYSMYGEEFGRHIKDIYIMGGNYQGIGNSTRSAEFNFHSDPEAAYAVLQKSPCPITILPWEPCLEKHFPIHINWRLQEFGERTEAINHGAISMLNRVERVQYLPMSELGFNSWNPCDALLIVAYLFEKEFVKRHSTWHATVDLSGTHTRGQMVLDHLREIDKYPENVKIIELVDSEFFKCAVEWVAGLRQFL